MWKSLIFLILFATVLGRRQRSSRNWRRKNTKKKPSLGFGASSYQMMTSGDFGGTEFVKVAGRNQECAWSGEDISGRSTPKGKGHSVSECLQACKALADCKYSAISESGYCHNFETCEGKGRLTIWTVYERVTATRQDTQVDEEDSLEEEKLLAEIEGYLNGRGRLWSKNDALRLDEEDSMEDEDSVAEEEGYLKRRKLFLHKLFKKRNTRRRGCYDRHNCVCPTLEMEVADGTYGMEREMEVADGTYSMEPKEQDLSWPDRRVLFFRRSKRRSSKKIYRPKQCVKTRRTRDEPRIS